MKKIHVDQLGYRTTAAKKAVLVTNDAAFEICRADGGETVFSGIASELTFCPASGEDVRAADFGGFTENGRFFIRNSEGESYPFDIGVNPYKAVTRALLDFFEYQKCGVAVSRGIWSYSPCHTDDAVVYGTNERKNVSGGWHDAGDYGRYVSPAAKAVADLLLAYRLAANPVGGIPEIVRFELDWMLKMQDDATGGVYHKVTAKTFCGSIMPDAEKEPLYLSPVSPTATGGFAAVLALASRVYRDSAYADMLLAAAEKAWQWLAANPDCHGFKNPEGIVTGEYRDDESGDERLWAACELYAATRKELYHDYIKNSPLYTGFGWEDMGSYALLTYLLLPADATDALLRERMKNRMLDVCESLLRASDPYMVSLTYPWGSNMILANNAVQLLVGNLLKPNAAYVEAAAEHIHYLFGRNALSQCYVTGFGSQPVVSPHHRPSEAAGKAVPGMVSGGPSEGTEDPFAEQTLKGNPPMKCFIDDARSYSTNEVTIYWNSPVYLALKMLE